MIPGFHTAYSRQLYCILQASGAAFRCTGAAFHCTEAAFRYTGAVFCCAGAVFCRPTAIPVPGQLIRCSVSNFDAQTGDFSCSAGLSGCMVLLYRSCILLLDSNSCARTVNSMPRQQFRCPDRRFWLLCWPI